MVSKCHLCQPEFKRPQLPLCLVKVTAGEIADASTPHL